MAASQNNGRHDISTSAIEQETINHNEPPSTSHSRASTKANDNGDENTNCDNKPPEMHTEIEALARQLTQASAAFDTELHAFNPQPGTQLDPGSTNFDSREWVRALIKLTESDPGAAPPRSLGVAFQKLDVFGWGSGAEHQKSVLDYPLDIVSSFVDLFGGNRNKRRIDILRNFEGVVDTGELLLVLGPPGSGCSTLLKTIAGETSGLEVSSDSYMNFRGRISFPILCCTRNTNHLQVSTPAICAKPSAATSSTTPKSTAISPISPSAKPYPSQRAPIPFAMFPAASVERKPIR